MATGQNNKANVSTVKGVAGGYLFWAPLGTEIPTDWDTELDDAFECLGYIGEDGMTESYDPDSEEIKDMNQETVDEYDGAPTETIQFNLIEIAEQALKMTFGKGNVTTTTKTISVVHDWSNAKDHFSLVAELVMKNGRRWRKVIPEGLVSERGEGAMKGNEVYGREITVKYLKDNTHLGCYDYIQQVGYTIYPDGDPSNSWTVEQLRAYCADHSIDLTGKTSKAEILEAIQAASA